MALLVLAGCVSVTSVKQRYDNHFPKDEQATNATTIIFLVDGLSVSLLQKTIAVGQAPEIKSYFDVRNPKRMPLGRASFPSLTFPNLASILIGESVAKQPIIGNRIWYNDRPVNFEDVQNWGVLHKLIGKKLIFSKLAEQHLPSVSLSYPFQNEATASLYPNIDVAADYIVKDYGGIDLDTIHALRVILDETALDHWPRFIFVHLIGVDSLSHEKGPKDAEVQTYLHDIDASLAPVFKTLRSAESRRDLQVVLTADHGFVTTNTVSPLGAVVQKMPSAKDVRVLIDNRISGIFLPDTMPESTRQAFAKGLVEIPHLKWAAIKSKNHIEIYKNRHTRGKIDIADQICKDGDPAARFNWVGEKSDPNFYCLSKYDQDADGKDSNFIIPALVDYFMAPTSPDIIAVADDTSDFTGAYRGDHGGLTREEMLVPLLLHGVERPVGVLPTSKLLRWLDLPHQASQIN
jgi:hypothetical protein